MAASRGRGHTSVARIRDAWYPVCSSEELSDDPLARTLMGTPLALFRNSAGAPSAVVDRCPHRNVPLSFGRVTKGELQCRYHGWRFDGAGTCTHVPGLLMRDANSRARDVEAYPTRESDGLIWVYATPRKALLGEPTGAPFRFAHQGEPGYATVRETMDFEASIHATAENALDVLHTSYLHGGLFRDDQRRNEITAEVHRTLDRVSVEYKGEPRPGGLAGKIIAPKGGTVEHFDRFILPSIAQVEYRLGKNHLLITSALSPVEDFLTRMFAVVTFRLSLAPTVVSRLIRPLILRILRQDAEVLRLQTHNIRRFDGEQYASTELDLLGPHILRLMRQAEAGERPGGEIKKTVHLTV